MSKLVAPHGGKGLVCVCCTAVSVPLSRIRPGLKKIEISARAKGDLIMMGIGGFSPLTGFMTKADWKGVCEKFQMADGTFWPVPITLDVYRGRCRCDQSWRRDCPGEAKARSMPP